MCVWKAHLLGLDASMTAYMSLMKKGKKAISLCISPDISKMAV